MVLVTTLYRCRVKAFIHLNVHPFDVDECCGEDMEYDVFVSCAHEDRDAAHSIVERLERDDDNVERAAGDHRAPAGGGYRVCYHERDFLPGSLITDNIQKAIERSKRVVCLLTRNFMRSDFCMMEFRGAWNHSTRLKKRRLLVLKWPDVDVDVGGPVSPDSSEEAAMADVRLFLSTHTYISYSASDWWEKLLYALPVQRLLRSNRHNQTGSDREPLLNEARSYGTYPEFGR